MSQELDRESNCQTENASSYRNLVSGGAVGEFWSAEVPWSCSTWWSVGASVQISCSDSSDVSDPSRVC